MRHRNDDGDVMDSALERIDVYCTGGLYNDPELGPTSRHGRQKLRRMRITRTGRVTGLAQRDPMLKCPQCGRHVIVAGSHAVEDPLDGHPETGLRIDAGVWQRVAGFLAREDMTRRVASVDISDPRYPW